MSVTAPQTDAAPAIAGEDMEARVLGLVRGLARELHPERADVATLALDAALDRDFGIDSLARAELLARLERAFAVGLAEDAVMDAETARDLLAAIARAHPPARASLPAAPLAAGEAEVVPRAAATLLEVLAFHRASHAARVHVRLVGTEAAERALTYDELAQGAEAIAAGLLEAEVAPGEIVALMLPTGADFFRCFLGVLIAGCVPAPLYPPARRAHVAEHLLRQAAIVRNARVPLLVTTDEALRFGHLLQAQAESLRHVVTPEALVRPGAAPPWPRLAPTAPALVQYTSGSTGDPKGVVLSHANLLANIHALAGALDAGPRDVVVNWLPLYHDMGLIGHWLGSLTYACPMVCMPPLHFLARPERWLRAISDHGGTLSAAPNFAYELCAARVREGALDGLDLSSWRMAGCGAEAVSASTIARFAARFARWGFRPSAMTPMYGLAESAVALTVSPLGRGPRIDRVRRDSLARGNRAEPAGGAEPAVEVVGCGLPIAGHQVRIVGAAGAEAGDREVGRIEFQGPSCTAGYLRAAAKNAALFHGAWLESGDLGYIADGELFVTGRAKDVIVRAGRNLYPEEIEAAVGALAEVRTGRVAAFAAPDPATGSERLIVLAETRLADPQRRAALAARVRELVAELAELPPDEVVLARPGTVLKTNNGKLRRAACRRLYEAGRLDRPPPAPWRQTLAVVQASLGPAWRRARAAAAALAYAAWFQAVYRGLAPVVWLLVVALPATGARRRLLRSAARLMMRALGLGPAAVGLANLPRMGAHVIAANHASYLDSLALIALLPPRYGFVAKRELGEGAVSGLFLRRLGALFVDRLDPRAGPEDLARMVAALGAGAALVVYPEGTFDRRPGLRPFHLGAFAAAAKAGVPVVPVAIRGSRAVLRGDSRFARRGRITVTVHQPIAPAGADWAEALRLRDLVRAALLVSCGEPDLIFEPARVPDR